MILEGDTLIPADRGTVWKALNDPEMLRACIPGCQSLEKLSDTDFTSSVRAAIGPISATFGAKINLTEIEPDRGYTIVGEGKGGAAGFARGKAKVDLSDEEGGTRLRYSADVNVGGKLAQVGSRLIQGTARKLSEQFFACLTEKLSPDPVLAQDPASTTGRTVPVVAATSAGRFVGWIPLGMGAVVLAILLAWFFR